MRDDEAALTAAIIAFATEYGRYRLSTDRSHAAGRRVGGEHQASAIRRLAQPSRRSPPDTPGRGVLLIGRYVICVNVATVGGRIMKMMTREQHFAAPKLERRSKGRLERGIAAVSAARARATEITQQTRRPRLAPIRSQGRRRVERLSALVTSNH